MPPPTFRGGLPSPIELFWKQSHGHTHIYFHGDTKLAKLTVKITYPSHTLSSSSLEATSPAIPCTDLGVLCPVKWILKLNHHNTSSQEKHLVLTAMQQSRPLTTAVASPLLNSLGCHRMGFCLQLDLPCDKPSGGSSVKFRLLLPSSPTLSSFQLTQISLTFPQSLTTCPHTHTASKYLRPGNRCP